MKIMSRFLAFAIFAAFVCSYAWAAPLPQTSDSAYHDVSLADVAKITVGSSTADQVKQLLGPPYRMTNYGDCSPIDYQEFWDYIGHDPNGGLFLIHIEFDESHIARIIAKDSKHGPIVVLAAAPKPAKTNTAHHHEQAGK
jgi:outer membrane protein assembly factor BamE (lipoprotein component of BamABCDE complex)